MSLEIKRKEQIPFFLLLYLLSWHCESVSKLLLLRSRLCDLPSGVTYF